jgi:hypothetical protein
MNSVNHDFSNNSLEHDEVSVRDLILKIISWYRFLISKSKIILFSAILGSIILFFVSLYDKPIYKAVLTFAMEEEKGNAGAGISGALGLASSFGIDLSTGGGAFSASNLSEFMKSRLIIDKVLLEPINYNGRIISLIEYYIDKNQLRRNWEKNPKLKNIKYPPNADRNKFNLQEDSILKQIHKELIKTENLNILQKDKKISIYSIEVKSNDELFSKVFCENIARETSRFYIETKSKKASINVNILQKQVDSVKSELNGAITGVATETDNVYNLNPAYNIKGASFKKKQVDVQANTAIITNLIVQLELAKITLRKETPLIQLIDKPIFPLEKIKFGKLKAIAFGLFFGSFLSIFYLSIKQVFKKIIN